MEGGEEHAWASMQTSPADVCIDGAFDLCADGEIVGNSREAAQAAGLHIEPHLSVGIKAAKNMHGHPCGSLRPLCADGEKVGNRSGAGSQVWILGWISIGSPLWCSDKSIGGVTVPA